MVRFFGMCIGIMLLIFTPIWIVQGWLHNRQVSKREFAQAKRDCDPLFSAHDSQVIFGGVPTGGEPDRNGDYGSRMDMCEFKIPYAGHAVTLAVGYTCGRGPVHDAWNSNEDWGNDPRLRGFRHAVYDNSSTVTATQQVAAKFSAYGIPRMVWLSYFDSTWIPAETTTTAALRLVIKHGSNLQQC